MGGVAGIIFSIYKKTGFWKGAGNYFIGGFSGSILGLTGASIFIKDKKNNEI